MKTVSRGFTLIELITAMLVLAILIGIAAPSFRDFTRNSRVTAAQNDLVTAFTYARGEALRRGSPVSVCASADAATCSGARNWATGWIAFVDSDATAGARDAANETLLQSWEALNGDMVLASDGATYIQYGPTGTTSPSTAATFQVRTNDCTGPHMRQVGVSPIGSLTSTTVDCP